jgi:hypothetical protein
MCLSYILIKIDPVAYLPWATDGRSSGGPETVSHSHREEEVRVGRAVERCVAYRGPTLTLLLCWLGDALGPLDLPSTWPH